MYEHETREAWTHFMAVAGTALEWMMEGHSDLSRVYISQLTPFELKQFDANLSRLQQIIAEQQQAGEPPRIVKWRLHKLTDQLDAKLRGGSSWPTPTWAVVDDESGF